MAVTCLIGTLAIAGVPPLNGFVSEWLMLQTFMFFSEIPSFYLTMLIPVVAAAFVLTLGLSAYVMVKFYGILFLGRPRDEQVIRDIQKATFWERCSLGWLALGCLIVGIFPLILLDPLTQLTTTLLGQPSLLNVESSWLFVVPITAKTASYSPVLLFITIVGVFTAVSLLIRKIYPAQTARMQDTAEGFGQPIKFIFAPFMHIQLEVPNGFDRTPQFRMRAEDRFWQILYFPFVKSIAWTAKLLSKLQQGRINHYLLYSFVTLLILLWWVV